MANQVLAVNISEEVRSVSSWVPGSVQKLLALFVPVSVLQIPRTGHLTRPQLG